MTLHEALKELEAQPDGPRASRALRELVHDLNTQLGALVLSTDDVGRFARILTELGRRREEDTLTRGGQQLAEAEAVMARSLEEIQALLQAVAATASKLQ